MKKIILLATALFTLTLLTACGGGAESGSTNITPPTNSSSLIIDNGRGTVNNQDTEKAQ